MLNEDEDATMTLIHAKLCDLKTKKQFTLHLAREQRDLLIEKLPELLKLDILKPKRKESDLEMSKMSNRGARFLALEMLILDLKLEKNKEHGFTFTNDEAFQEHYVIKRDL